MSKKAKIICIVISTTLKDIENQMSLTKEFLKEANVTEKQVNWLPIRPEDKYPSKIYNDILKEVKNTFPVNDGDCIIFPSVAQMGNTIVKVINNVKTINLAGVNLYSAKERKRWRLTDSLDLTFILKIDREIKNWRKDRKTS